MSFWIFYLFKINIWSLIIDLFLNCILESFWIIWKKNSNARIFDCWVIRPNFRSLIVTMKFLKIYYSYIDTIHKYILNIYIHNISYRSVIYYIAPPYMHQYRISDPWCHSSGFELLYDQILASWYRPTWCWT